jgi:hypothetical protein
MKLRPQPRPLQIGVGALFIARASDGDSGTTGTA